MHGTGREWMVSNYSCITRKGMNICFPFRNNWVIWNMTCVAWILNAIFHTIFHVINLSLYAARSCHNMTIMYEMHLAFMCTYYNVSCWKYSLLDPCYWGFFLIKSNQ